MEFEQETELWSFESIWIGFAKMLRCKQIWTLSLGETDIAFFHFKTKVKMITYDLSIEVMEV